MYLYLEAARACLAELDARSGLVALILERVDLCRLGRLELKLGGVTVCVRGGTTQYSIGSPSRYGILVLASSFSCATPGPHLV